MIVRFFRHIFIVLLLCGLSAACSQLGGYPVNLIMPDSPNNIDCSWLIEYPASMESGVPLYTQEHVSGDSPVKIARGTNLPVFVRPVYELPGSVSIVGGFPAGAFFPCDVSGGELRADWEAGFACEILYRCLLNSDAVCAFDTAAFREAVETRTAEIVTESGLPVPGGNWLLDPVPVISRLGYGLFRSSSLTEAETMSFSIPAAAGIWYSDNPLYPPVEVEQPPTGPGTLNITVPVNRRMIFIEPLSAGVIEVYFNDERWCWSNLLSGASESGMR